MSYTTKATWLGKRLGYGCRIFNEHGKLVLEGRCAKREEIGAVFRCLLRTLDKDLDGDEFTSAARKRRYRPGNLILDVKHRWRGARLR